MQEKRKNEAANETWHPIKEEYAMHAPQISRESHPKSEHPSVTQPTSQPFIHSEQANLCVLCQKRWVDGSSRLPPLSPVHSSHPTHNCVVV